MSNILDQFLSPEKSTAPVEFNNAPIRTSNLDRFLNPTQTRQTEIIEQTNRNEPLPLEIVSENGKTKG